MINDKFYMLFPKVCEHELDDNKAYILTVKDNLDLGYTEALFCKSNDLFYFLPMGRFLGNLIPYQGDHKIKIISRKQIEDIWSNHKKDIEKKYRIDNLLFIQEYLYVFIYSLEHIKFETIVLSDFEEKIIDKNQ